MDFLTCPESDLPVKFGPFDSDILDHGDALHHLRYIFADINDIKSRYFRLGFHLNEFKSNLYYRDLGYLSMEDFVLENFGMDKSALSRCLGVFLAFNASREVVCRNGLEIHGCACDLAEKYAPYSYSQLCEMVSLSPEQRKQITPSMSISQIRALKKEWKEERVSRSSEELLVATSDNLIKDDLVRLKGAALRSKVKSASFVDVKHFYIFDDDGDFFFGPNGEPVRAATFDVLFEDQNICVIRLSPVEEVSD